MRPLRLASVVLALGLAGCGSGGPIPVNVAGVWSTPIDQNADQATFIGCWGASVGAEGQTVAGATRPCVYPDGITIAQTETAVAVGPSIRVCDDGMGGTFEVTLTGSGTASSTAVTGSFAFSNGVSVKQQQTVRLTRSGSVLSIATSDFTNYDIATGDPIGGCAIEPPRLAVSSLLP